MAEHMENKIDDQIQGGINERKQLYDYINKVKTFLKLLDNEHGLIDSWYGNGCEHGFKPSRECTNEDCNDRNLQRLWDEINDKIAF